MMNLTQLPEFILTPVIAGMTFDVVTSTVRELEWMEANFQADVDAHLLGEPSSLSADTAFFEGDNELRLIKRTLKTLRRALTIKRTVNISIRRAMRCFFY